MKRLGIALLILVLLIVGYLVLRSYPFQEEFTPPAEFKTSQWNQEAIDELSMNFGEEQITLVKEGDNWLVNNFQADLGRINQVFDALEGAKVTSRVSTNSINHERFQVDENKGVEVIFKNGGEEIQALIFGKSAGGSSAYIRLPEDEPVYVLADFPRYLLSEELDLWRDRKVFGFSPEQIRLVRYQAPAGTWIIEEAADSVWQISRAGFAPVSLDAQKVKNWLNGLVNMQASAFPEEADEPVQPVSTLTVELGTTEEFSEKKEYIIGQAQDSTRHMVPAEGEETLIPESTINSTLQTYNELVDSLKPDPETEN